MLVMCCVFGSRAALVLGCTMLHRLASACAGYQAYRCLPMVDTFRLLIGVSKEL
jgi:hypothetical protein